MRFSALFGEVFGQTALSSLTFEKWIFQVPPCRVFQRLLLRVTEKMQETGLSVFRPYPGQDYQTICRCHSQVAAHSPQMFLDWVFFWSKAWALDLRRSTTLTKQAVVFERLLTFAYAFYPHNRHWHTRCNWHLVCNPLLTKSEKRTLMAYIWKTHLSQ